MRINYLLDKVSYLAMASLAVLALMISSLSLITPVQADPVNETIMIHNCIELQAISDDLAADYALANDIDCSDSQNWDDGYGFYPLGYSYDSQFVGSFDGRGFDISDVYIMRPSHQYTGLFGYVSSSTIKNVNLVDINVTGQFMVGGLAGILHQSNVFNVSVVNTANNTGIKAYDDEGSVSAGGLTGVLSGSSDVHDVYVRSSVRGINGGYYAGLLIGHTSGAGGRVSNAYTSGTLVGSFSNNTGGPIFGDLYYDTEVTSVFWDNDVYGMTGYSGGTSRPGNEGNGRTANWLKNPSNLIEEGWDFDSVWLVDEGTNSDYPFIYLREDEPTDPNDSEPADLNGDNIPDNEQVYVSTTVSTSGKNVVLEVNDDCIVDENIVKAEVSNFVQDPSYDYPEGLMNFTVDCGDPGYTTTVRQYYYDVDRSNLVLRKYIPNKNAYFNVNGSVVSAQVINGQSVLVAEFQITDGGELDIDGEVNGIIVDPTGLASSVVGSPNTGIVSIRDFLFAKTSE